MWLSLKTASIGATWFAYFSTRDERPFGFAGLWERWEGEGVRELDLVKEMLRPYPAEEMVEYPVGASVNSPRGQGARLIERAAVNSA